MQRVWFWPFVIGVALGGGLSFAAAELVVGAGAGYMARAPQSVPKRMLGVAAPPVAQAAPGAAPDALEEADVDTSATVPATNAWLTGHDRPALAASAAP